MVKVKTSQRGRLEGVATATQAMNKTADAFMKSAPKPPAHRKSFEAPAPEDHPDPKAAKGRSGK